MFTSVLNVCIEWNEKYVYKNYNIHYVNIPYD